MSKPSSDMKKDHTYKDIVNWEGNWELIDGTPYLLASPSYKHQYIVGELFAELRRTFSRINLSGETYLTNSISFSNYLCTMMVELFCPGGSINVNHKRNC